jgi:hypothetical protein
MEPRIPLPGWIQCPCVLCLHVDAKSLLSDENPQITRVEGVILS